MYIPTPAGHWLRTALRLLISWHFWTSEHWAEQPCGVGGKAPDNRVGGQPESLDIQPSIMGDILCLLQ